LCYGPQLLETSAHDLEAIFVFFQEGMEEQGQVPTVADNAV